MGLVWQLHIIYLPPAPQKPMKQGCPGPQVAATRSPRVPFSHLPKGFCPASSLPPSLECLMWSMAPFQRL